MMVVALFIHLAMFMGQCLIVFVPYIWGTHKNNIYKLAKNTYKRPPRDMTLFQFKSTLPSFDALETYK
jgi:hypothetical protein